MDAQKHIGVFQRFEAWLSNEQYPRRRDLILVMTVLVLIATIVLAGAVIALAVSAMVAGFFEIRFSEAWMSVAIIAWPITSIVLFAGLCYWILIVVIPTQFGVIERRSWDEHG